MAANAPLREIRPTEVETFRRDGVALLPGMFGPEWIELLDSGLEKHRELPTPRARIWDRDEAGRTMFWDAMAWHGVEQYQRFVFESPAAAIAAQMLESLHIKVARRRCSDRVSTSWYGSRLQRDHPSSRLAGR